MPGTLTIVSAPSGAGKTTLVRGLLDTAVVPPRLSVSCTTRAPRVGEVEGEHYHFISVAEFEARRQQDEFVEWAEVHGNFYGTSRAWLADALAQGHDVVLEIDWQGASQVRRAFPDAISVFVLPPSFAALESRLRGRGTDDQATIARRIAAAREEMGHVNEFDYVIVNEDVDTAIADLVAIVRAGRLGCDVQKTRHAELFTFVANE